MNSKGTPKPADKQTENKLSSTSTSVTGFGKSGPIRAMQ
jgi:hypothetical protein